MSKQKKLKVLNKQQESSQKVSPTLQVEENALSPVANISAPLSNDFEKDIQKSKAEIAAADSAPKRGRKALPRDAAGNIIRTDSIPGAPVINPVMNEKEIQENKALLKEMIFPLLSGVAVKYALNDTRAALPEDQLEPMSQAGGEILTELFPGITSKYGKYGVFFGGFIYWGVSVKAIRQENLQKEIKETEIKPGIETEKRK